MQTASSTVLVGCQTFALPGSVCADAGWMGFACSSRTYHPPLSHLWRPTEHIPNRAEMSRTDALQKGLSTVPSFTWPCHPHARSHRWGIRFWISWLRLTSAPFTTRMGFWPELCAGSGVTCPPTPPGINKQRYGGMGTGRVAHELHVAHPIGYSCKALVEGQSYQGAERSGGGSPPVTRVSGRAPTPPRSSQVQNQDSN